MTVVLIVLGVLALSTITGLLVGYVIAVGEQHDEEIVAMLEDHDFGTWDD
jgi:hypothetical protein